MINFKERVIIFTIIDLRFNYHQVKIQEEDIATSVFQTRYGHYELLFMPFGLTNVPVVFVELINRVCKLHFDKFIIAFIDDILIYSQSKEECEWYLRIILEVFKQEKLYAKFLNYDFWL